MNGTKNHSISIRKSDFLNTIEVFRESPIIGSGFGGLYTKIASKKGYDIYNVEVQKVGTGLSVFAEILAASGIIGFYFFIKYIISLIEMPKKIKDHKYEYSILNSLINSLIMELIVLQFNQNILRMYLWIHIAVICYYYQVIVNDRKEEINENSD